MHKPAGDSAGSTDLGGRLASVQSHSDRKWRSAAPSAGAHVETPSSVGYMTPAGFVVWPRPSTWPSSCSRTGPALSVADSVVVVSSLPAASTDFGGTPRFSNPSGRWWMSAIAAAHISTGARYGRSGPRWQMRTPRASRTRGQMCVVSLRGYRSPARRISNTLLPKGDRYFSVQTLSLVKAHSLEGIRDDRH